jgi:hypothetical protein
MHVLEVTSIFLNSADGSLNEADWFHSLCEPPHILCRMGQINLPFRQHIQQPE